MIKEKLCFSTKGYENRSGRSINVAKALQEIYKDLKDFEIVFFLTSPKLFFDYLEDNKSEIDFNYRILDNIDHQKNDENNGGVFVVHRK